MTGIIDYDAGNMQSVQKALEFLGEEAVISRDPEELLAADRIVLPGVGNFGDAMENLRRFGLEPLIGQIVKEGTPFLGICLGLQLLFSFSEESPDVPGLSLLPGKILRFPKEDGIKIPHMGWNSLAYPRPGRLFAGIPADTYVYFVHSYYLEAEDPSIVRGTAVYGSTCIHASVEKGNLFACQFHPEKSGRFGLAILKNFTQIERGAL